MRAYQNVRAACERTIREAGLEANILRPWYVLGPGHRWPYVLIPFYRLFELIPATRDGATRLGLVTLPQMIAALAWAVQNPADGVRIIDVPMIRRISR
jgi:nucleoside-diphosphate-sugar epimerase